MCRTQPDPGLSAAPVFGDLVTTGAFRVHFNRHGAAPLVWCVATDEWELAVRGVVITVPVVTVYRPKETPDDEDGRPSAWLETPNNVRLVVRGGWATLEPL